MSMDTLHFTVMARTFRDVEQEATQRVADYTGWTHEQALARVRSGACVADLHVAVSGNADSVLYRGDVRVTV